MEGLDSVSRPAPEGDTLVSADKVTIQDFFLQWLSFLRIQSSVHISRKLGLTIVCVLSAGNYKSVSSTTDPCLSAVLVRAFFPA